ncbi:MAG: type I restriction enzyme HsdR N-terminal domain-containing protein [Bacteroidales bacterium]|nr:type I restriction enzyme HsdR N-terminal domain-containing protein [Bacteroidales bacterium]
MKQLNLPEYSFRIIRKGETDLILDPIRKKYVRLTPEEWVRQNFVQYLVHEGKYPAGLIGIEVMFKLNKLRKRADILVHNRKGEPVMLVECKSDEVKLDDKVNDQIVEYNMNYRIPYLVITNGMSHYAVKITDYDTHQFEYLLTIPLYEDLQT